MLHLEAGVAFRWSFQVLCLSPLCKSRMYIQLQRLCCNNRLNWGCFNMILREVHGNIFFDKIPEKWNVRKSTKDVLSVNIWKSLKSWKCFFYSGFILSLLVTIRNPRRNFENLCFLINLSSYWFFFKFWNLRFSPGIRDFSTFLRLTLPFLG